MTTSYPGALDSLTNPTGSDSLNTAGVVHSAQHANANDAIEAIEGELGTNPSGAYATVKARLDAVQSRVFDAVLYGAVVDGSTNDTAAWQAAIDACATAGGGIVTSSKPGVSIISGALQDTSGANSQLTLPQVDYVDSEPISIALVGPVPAPSILSVIGTTVAPDNHLVLKSTLASGSGAVIGAIGPSGTFGNFTSIHVHLENLTVRTVANPTVTALDLRRVASVSVGLGVVVDTGSYDVDALTQPSSSGSYGVRLPGNNNGAQVDVTRLDVVGFYTGVQHSEHLNADHIVTWGCRVGLETTAGNHASRIQRLMAVHCTTPWKATGGAAAIDVGQFDIEHASSSQGWRQTTNDIDDASNYLSTFVRWWSVLAGTGPHNSFTINGGTGVTASRVGAAIGASGSTIYWRRDRLVAAAGDNILTLGATPVASSPMVWVNNVIKWPTTDYTITGSTITFGTALSASDVVLSAYETTNASPSAAALSSNAVNIVDNFTRADSTSALGSTSTGSKTWTQKTGTWGIATNKAYCSNGNASQLNFAYVDAAVADGTLSAVLTTTSGPAYAGMIFRENGSDSCYFVEVQVGASYAPTIYKRVAGSQSTLTSGSAITFASGDTLSVVLAGSSITVKRNGTTIVSTTDSTFNANTKHGMYIVAPASTTSTIRIDDFSIQP